MKVFISHSGADKESCVDMLVKRLIAGKNKDCIVYDTISFEAGEKTIDEILWNMERTDLFVILLSRKALNSSWVHKELTLAKEYLGKGKLDRIYPLIIDPQLQYDDESIPSWLRAYNLKYTSNTKKLANMITSRAKNISWKRYPDMKRLSNIFVGRNNLVEKFEIRLDDFDKGGSNTFIVSGLPDIGRRSLARHCLVKGNVVKEDYTASKLLLTRNDSIEDFIIKLDDLGFNNEITVDKIEELSMSEKIDIAIRLSEQLLVLSEHAFVYDEGCLIDYRGDLSAWFAQIIKHPSISGSVLYVIITRYKVNFESIRNIQSAFTLQVPELNTDERKGLLRRLSSLRSIELSTREMEMILPNLKGYPGQIYYVIDLIQEKGLPYLKNNMKKVIDYNEQNVSLLLEKYGDDDRVQHVLALVSRHDAISIDMLRTILLEKKDYIDLYEQLLQDSIFELEGVNGEYIRVNEVVRDYITRTKIQVLPEHSIALEKIFREMFSSEDSTWYNVTDFLLGLRDNVRNGKDIPHGYRIPSIYLKGMMDLYSEMKYKDVVVLAKRALANTDNIEERIVHEIRNRMCLAMAKQQQEECLVEAKSLKPENKGFIYAFYYRQIGRNDKALEELNRLLEKRPNFSQAKREKVLVLTRLQQYDEALVLAKENHYLYKDNPYHLQAYFDCLINTMNSRNRDGEDILGELLERLERIKSEKAQSMYSRCYALYLAYIEGSKDSALAQVKKSQTDYPKDSIYALMVKFAIAFFYGDQRVMMDAIEELKHMEANTNTIILCESKYFAMEDNEKAKNYFLHHIKWFTESSKNIFLEKLDRIYQTKGGVF